MCSWGIMIMLQHFNPRSHEGSDNSLKYPATNSAFQSTLPRGERQNGGYATDVTYVISIHAPTRGATFFLVVRRLHPGISIHAPTRGATMWWVIVDKYTVNFNPRSHEGSDGLALVKFAFQNDFNPRSHEGSDSNFRQKVLFSLSKNCLKYLILTTNYFN